LSASFTTTETVGLPLLEIGLCVGMVLLAPTIIPKTGARELFPATASLACAFYGEAVVGWPCGLVAPSAATRLFGPRRVCTTRFHLHEAPRADVSRDIGPTEERRGWAPVAEQRATEGNTT